MIRAPQARTISGVIVFDIYGTVIDPDGMAAYLETRFAARAQEAARLWRDKQIEYSFRRALMRKYVNFDVCTEQALNFVCQGMQVDMSDRTKRELLKKYHELPAFPDVTPALDTLANAGFMLAALTNGTATSVRSLLRHAGILSHLKTIISVDEIRTYKPNPAVYRLLVRRLRRRTSTIWFVSSNPWDVIGAKAYGLKSVWLRRDPTRNFDPWEFSPDVIVTSLERLFAELPQQK